MLQEHLGDQMSWVALQIILEVLYCRLVRLPKQVLFVSQISNKCTYARHVLYVFPFCFSYRYSTDDYVSIFIEFSFCIPLTFSVPSSCHYLCSSYDVSHGLNVTCWIFQHATLYCHLFIHRYRWMNNLLPSFLYLR